MSGTGTTRLERDGGAQDRRGRRLAGPPAEPGTPSLQDDLAVRLRMVVVRLFRRLERTRAGEGLTATEAGVLATTVRRGPLRISQLAQDEGMNPTMLSRVLRRLEGAGLLARHSDPADARAAFVEATSAGRLRQEAIKGERSDVLSAALARLSPADLARLEGAAAVLERLAEELKGRRP